MKLRTYEIQTGVGNLLLIPDLEEKHQSVSMHLMLDTDPARRIYIGGLDNIKQLKNSLEMIISEARLESDRIKLIIDEAKEDGRREEQSARILRK